MLAGGDRRSIGRADEVVALVRQQPRLLASLLNCICSDDPVLTARAANAAEKLSRDFIERFQPYKALLLDLLAEAQQTELRWQLALMVPRLNLTLSECRRAASILESFLQDCAEDRSSLVKTFAMQGLSDLLRQNPARRSAILELLRLHSRTGTAAMRARGRILLKQLEAPQQHSARSSHPDD
jgi:hypothetical protein